MTARNLGRNSTSKGRRLAASTIAGIAAAEMRNTLVSMVPLVGPPVQTILFGIQKALKDHHARLDLESLQFEIAAMKEQLPKRADQTRSSTPEQAIEELQELFSSLDENAFRIAIAAAQTMIADARSKMPDQAEPEATLGAFAGEAENFYAESKHALDSLNSLRLDKLPRGRRRDLIEMLLAMRREVSWDQTNGRYLDPRTLHPTADVYDSSIVHDFLTTRSWHGFICFEHAREMKSVSMTPEHFEEVRRFVIQLLEHPPVSEGRIFGLTNRIFAITQKGGVKLVPYVNPVDEARAERILNEIISKKPESRVDERAVLADARSLARLHLEDRLITASAPLARKGDTDRSLFPRVQQSYGAAWGAFRTLKRLEQNEDEALFDAIDCILDSLLTEQRMPVNTRSARARSTILSAVEKFHEDSAERLRQAGDTVGREGQNLILLFRSRVDEFIDAIESIASSLEAFADATPQSADVSSLGGK